MIEWFNKQNNIVRGILLLIPLLGWILEMVIRWTYYANNKDNSTNLLFAILYTIPPTGYVLAIVDAVFLFIGKNMLFME